MNADRFDVTMTTFHERVPFRPFTVVLLNGNRHEVDHRSALIMRAGTAVYVSPGGAPVIFDYESASEIIGDLSGTPSDDLNGSP